MEKRHISHQEEKEMASILIKLAEKRFFNSKETYAFIDREFISLGLNLAHIEEVLTPIRKEAKKELIVNFSQILDYDIAHKEVDTLLHLSSTVNKIQYAGVFNYTQKSPEEESELPEFVIAEISKTDKEEAKEQMKIELKKILDSDQDIIKRLYLLIDAIEESGIFPKKKVLEPQTDGCSHGSGGCGGSSC